MIGAHAWRLLAVWVLAGAATPSAGAGARLLVAHPTAETIMDRSRAHAILLRTVETRSWTVVTCPSCTPPARYRVVSAERQSVVGYGRYEEMTRYGLGEGRWLTVAAVGTGHRAAARIGRAWTCAADRARERLGKILPKPLAAALTASRYLFYLGEPRFIRGSFLHGLPVWVLRLTVPPSDDAAAPKRGARQAGDWVTTYWVARSGYRMLRQSSRLDLRLRGGAVVHTASTTRYLRYGVTVHARWPRACRQSREPSV